MAEAPIDKKQSMYADFITRRGEGENEFDAFCGAVGACRSVEFEVYRVMTALHIISVGYIYII